MRNTLTKGRRNNVHIPKPRVPAAAVSHTGAFNPAPGEDSRAHQDVGVQGQEGARRRTSLLYRE